MRWRRGGKGTARLAVDPGGEVLTVLETGRWWDLPRRPVSSPNEEVVFRKGYCLKRKGNSSFGVWNLKVGPENGRHLVDLEPSGVSGVWQTDKPHLCGADSYWAKLAILGPESLLLDWFSEGPKKCYSTHSTYREVGAWIDWLVC